jgi:putative Holliday junction resolvase
MRILGIDFGDKNLGLALSDRLLITAQVFCSYRLKNKEEDEQYFKELVSKHEIGQIVIGLPLRMDGSEGTRVEKTKKFALWLENILHLPIILWDERLTTQQALKILQQQKIKDKKKKSIEDQISAALILSSYLERKRTESDGPQNY